MALMDLSIVPGKVVKFRNKDLKIPHMGWNSVNQVCSHPLWHNIDNNCPFYSVHSYFVDEDDASCVVGTTHYGETFTSAIAIDKSICSSVSSRKIPKRWVAIAKKLYKLELRYFKVLK